jgi:hypothetical protein
MQTQRQTHGKIKTELEDWLEFVIIYFIIKVCEHPYLKLVLTSIEFLNTLEFSFMELEIIISNYTSKIFLLQGNKNIKYLINVT